MNMSKRSYLSVFLAVVAASVLSYEADAQTYGHFTPYSVYGVGELSSAGTAYNSSMAGVGIAGRDNRYLNILNPASVTARDSLSVLIDFSAYSDNKIFTQGDVKSVYNTANIGSLAMSFPIYRSSAFMIGITPYSGTGFGYRFHYDDPSVIGHTGDITYTAEGRGALYQAFLGAGVTFFNRLSVGAQAIYYFGQTDKSYTTSFSDASYSGVKNGQSISLNAVGGRFGVQYEQPLGNGDVICAGATYTLNSKLMGYLEDYSYSTSSAATDTLKYRADTLTAAASKARLASQIGVGLSYRHSDRWMVELDYTFADWRNAGLSNYSAFRGNSGTTSQYSSFSSNVAHNVRLGFEYVPNRNDIRYYFNKVTYRGGLYYKQDYFKVDGYPINAYGLTLGLTFPLNRRYNSISLGVELGQRGTVKSNLIRENYVNFTLGISIFDIWFEKHKYM